VPIIVMTAVGAGPEQEAVQNAGCTTVLMKPFGLSSLIADMNRLLEVHAESNRSTPRRESSSGGKAGAPGFPVVPEPDPRTRRKRPS
jgi:DNA-binding response OmpR family regulator